MQTRKLGYGAATDVGCRREHNEDSFGVVAQRGVFFVADGMGGHGGGDVASRIACERIAAAVGEGTGLAEAILQAHAAVVEAAANGEGSPDMGTTIVALRSAGDGYEIVWVGDSRAYLWDGQLRQLSRDHSLLQEYLDTRGDAATGVDLSQWKNVITRCLGPANSGTPRADAVRGGWNRGEKILLCSDGLHGELSQEALTEVLRGAQDRDEQATVDALIEAARTAGGSDNITAVLVAAPAGAGGGARKSSRFGRPGMSLLLGIAVAALAAALVLYFVGGR